MIRRRFLRSGVAAAFLCGFVQMCFAAGTHASGISATPAHEWAVGPISAKSSNGASYCSMKNTYPDGQTLVFARDNQGSNSIALDFHKNFFDVSRQYNVRVRVGSVMRRVVALV